VERHFREVHLSTLIRSVETWTTTGVAAQALPSPMLRKILRRAWDEQHRFPLKVVTVLSQQLASHGLQFFKVNKTLTHVSVARPHHLDREVNPVSDGVRRIVEFIDSRPGCSRKQLMEALVPASAGSATTAANPPTPGQAAPESPTATDSPGSPAPAPEPAAKTPGEDLETAVVADLHWLIHQGHVIEFANGKLETAKKPKPKPVKPPPSPAQTPADSPAPAATEPLPANGGESGQESGSSSGEPEPSISPPEVALANTVEPLPDSPGEVEEPRSAPEPERTDEPKSEVEQDSDADAPKA
jgi:hypothetical protein